MAIYEIPLNTGNQKFNISLNKKLYKFQLIFRAGQWVLDILDTAESPLVTGLPLVMGVNLLGQHQHIMRGNLAVLNSNKSETQSFGNIGSNIKLYWSDS